MWIEVEIWQHTFKMRRRGSSLSIVSNYGLDDRAIGVRSSAGAKNFSCSLCVQTGSEAHPASCTMGTGGPSPGAKRGLGVTLTTHPHLVPRSRSRSYTSSPPQAPPRRAAGLLCFYLQDDFEKRCWVSVDTTALQRRLCVQMCRDVRTTSAALLWGIRCGEILERRKFGERPYRNCVRPWYMPWKI
jgi:hypothetical protein